MLEGLALREGAPEGATLSAHLRWLLGIHPRTKFGRVGAALLIGSLSGLAVHLIMITDE